MCEGEGRRREEVMKEEKGGEERKLRSEVKGGEEGGEERRGIKQRNR